MYCSKLGCRAEAFKLLFRELYQGYPRKLIIETGCLRKVGNWEGDGQSTLMFDQFANLRLCEVFSIDISPESLVAARSVCGPRTQLFLGDSVAALRALARITPLRKAALLYLDSFDLSASNPRPSAEHHLMELTAAMPLLDSGSLICVDDCEPNGGKGALVIPFMDKIGAEKVYDGYQKIWRMP